MKIKQEDWYSEYHDDHEYYDSMDSYDDYDMFYINRNLAALDNWNYQEHLKACGKDLEKILIPGTIFCNDNDYFVVMESYDNPKDRYYGCVKCIFYIRDEESAIFEELIYTNSSGNQIHVDNRNSGICNVPKKVLLGRFTKYGVKNDK